MQKYKLKYNKNTNTITNSEKQYQHCLNCTFVCTAWDGKEVASVGEGEEGGLVGGAELGDPNLAGGPALPMKL